MTQVRTSVSFLIFLSAVHQFFYIARSAMHPYFTHPFFACRFPYDYSGTLRATCPDFESHHSGEWEPYIPVIQSHLIGLYYIYFLYTVNTHLWCEYR